MELALLRRVNFWVNTLLTDYLIEQQDMVDWVTKPLSTFSLWQKLEQCSDNFPAIFGGKGFSISILLFGLMKLGLPGEYAHTA